MYFQTPHAAYHGCRAIVEEKIDRKPKLHLVRRIPDRQGLSLRCRVCAAIGDLLMRLAMAMYAFARLPKLEVDEESLSGTLAGQSG